MAWKEWRKKSFWGQMAGWMEGWVEELLNNHFSIVGSFCLSFIWNWNMNSYKNTDISISVRNQSVHLTVYAYFINCSNPVFRLIYMWVHLTLTHTDTVHSVPTRLWCTLFIPDFLVDCYWPIKSSANCLFYPTNTSEGQHWNNVGWQINVLLGKCQQG